MFAANSLVTGQGLDRVVRSLEGHGLLMMIVAVCLVGLVIVLLLLRTWRRYNLRLNRPPPKHQPMADIWHAAAERLTETDQSEAEPDEPEPDDTDEPTSEP